MKFRRILLGVVLLGITVVAPLLLRRATLRSAQVTAVVSGGAGPFPVADIAWAYRSGVRPINLIIDLVSGSGASGSLTADGEQINGDIPLPGSFSGPYTLTATATYRVLGVVRTSSQTFSGEV